MHVNLVLARAQQTSPQKWLPFWCLDAMFAPLLIVLKTYAQSTLISSVSSDEYREREKAIGGPRRNIRPTDITHAFPRGEIKWIYIIDIVRKHAASGNIYYVSRTATRGKLANCSSYLMSRDCRPPLGRQRNTVRDSRGHPRTTHLHTHAPPHPMKTL